PRALPLGEMVAFTTDVSRRVAAVDPAVKHNYITTLTQLSRELFASSEGALIDQSFALTQGMCYVIGVYAQVSQELYDVLGHQRGWEILASGIDEIGRASCRTECRRRWAAYRVDRIAG